jgi:transposase-like protein
MSDRAIAESAGLAAKSVASIRRRETDAAPELNARLGKDGKVRPLDSSEGRRRAAQLLTDQPQASLREVAKQAGISPGTVRDVRRRLERGMDPILNLRNDKGHTDNGSDNHGAIRKGQRTIRMERLASASILEKLMRDPSLRHSERGRQLLRLLQSNAIQPQERSKIIDSIPLHCADLVAQIAREYAGMWQEFAQDLSHQVRRTLSAGRLLSGHHRALGE